jgi:hypothetical protein
MKNRLSIHSIQACMMMAALAVPMAFAQDASPAPMQDSSSMQSSSAMSSDKPMPWKQLDTNKDGKLSKEEVAGDSQLTADFDAADTNKDGFLSKVEFRAHRMEMKKMAKK